MITPKVPHIFFGGDYNPEQWPEDVWREDMHLMRAAGVNLVTLGVFAWAKLEPRPGEYDFAWFDRIMDLLHANGICVDLATATASPPPWLARLHPTSLPVTAQGVTLWPGARQHFCPSSRAYREAAANLVEHLATRYRQHPALALWHVNNEYGVHVSECYCDQSAAAFRAWLQLRYGALDALNAAWGTAFWSQQYSAWEEILPPRSAPTFPNPTQQLDFKRFSSDELLVCFENEKAILQAITPDIPITTNFLGFHKPVNYQQWATREDVVSIDSYTDPSAPDAPAEAAMQADLARSLKLGQPWILIEQTPSQVNWRAVNVLKRPGQMRLWSYQALARAADGIMFFQWRASQAGAEKFHGGMVPHIGTDHSRVWDEVRQLGNELSGLDELVASRTHAEVALIFDWESWWALEFDSKPSTLISAIDQLARFHRVLFAHNITADIVPPSADLAQYKIILIPNLYLVHPGFAEKLEQHVAAGGKVMMSFFSGIVDAQDHILLGGYPAPFRKLLGIRVAEFDPYIPGQTNRIITSTGQRSPCDLWSDVIELEGATALATYEQDFYAGYPAVTRHQFGQGQSYYIGTRLDPAYLAALLLDVCRDLSLPPLQVPAGVEVVRRGKDSQTYWFVLNHTTAAVTVTLDHALVDLLSGEHYQAGAVTLAGYGVLVMREGQ